MDNHIKYIARFMVETLSALAIGAGRDGLLNERLIAKDANGLPYLPGTSIAGVVRHELPRNEEVDRLFGFQSIKENEGSGSRIVFSPGLLVTEDGKTILEGIQNIDFSKPYFSDFKTLPHRDHVRINHRGVAEKTGKFEEQLVRKGTRFAFEIEIEGSKKDEELWLDILRILNAPSFRIGAGTRKGFGQLKVLSCIQRQFDLKQIQELKDYLGKSSSLNAFIPEGKPFKEDHIRKDIAHYQLAIKPESFFLFGSGLWGKDADASPKEEEGYTWENGKNPTLKTHYLIPATSIKGAIAHRVAFHYNSQVGASLEGILEAETPEKFDYEKAIAELIRGQIEGSVDSLSYPANSDEWDKIENTISNLTIEQSLEWKDHTEILKHKSSEEYKLPVGENNDAVKALFGYSKDDKEGARGKVIFSDVFLEKEDIAHHYFNHVSIDRFTGGARAGALFTQKTSAYKSSKDIVLDIYVEQDALADEKIKIAFEQALDDLCSGRLQLGSSTTKGHGAFSGKRTPQ